MRSHSQKTVTNWAGPWSTPEAAEKPWRVRLLAAVNCAILVDNLVSEWASQRERASAERGTPSPHGIRHGAGGVLVTAGEQKSWGWGIGAKPDQLGIPQSPINSCIGTIAGAVKAMELQRCACRAHVEPMSTMTGPLSLRLAVGLLFLGRWNPQRRWPRPSRSAVL